MSERRKRQARPKHRGRTWTLGASVALVVGGLGVVGWMKIEAGSFDDPESPGSPDGVIVHEVPEQQKDLDEFWTEERMRNAEPL